MSSRFDVLRTWRTVTVAIGDIATAISRNDIRIAVPVEVRQGHISCVPLRIAEGAGYSEVALAIIQVTSLRSGASLLTTMSREPSLLTSASAAEQVRSGVLPCRHTSRT